MTELEEVTERRLDISKWLRTLRYPQIAAGWGLLLLVGLVVGSFASWRGWTFLSDVAANFVPDIFVAGLAFIVAEAIFGFRERQEQRAEEQRRVIEARRKAYSVLIGEMTDNVELLDLIVKTMQGGRLPPGDIVLSTEYWQLLVQGGLARLPGELVVTLAESYYEGEARLKRLRRHLSRFVAMSEAAMSSVADEFRPEFEEDLKRTKSAIRMLKQYASET